MADQDPHSPAQQDGSLERPPLPDMAADSPQRNGTGDARPAEGPAHVQAPIAPGGAAAETTDEHDDRSGLEQAEAIVDHFASRVSSLVGLWGRKLLRLTSRARESAQDFWAEVQDFRQGKKS
jgi:hypothetical protein